MEIKDMESLKEFSPDGFVRKRLFETSNLHCNIYCIEPGQINDLHKHPDADEVLLFVEGAGEAVGGMDRRAVRHGTVALWETGTPHEIVNTGGERMVCLLVQGPLPVIHVPVPDPRVEEGRHPAMRLQPLGELLEFSPARYEKRRVFETPNLHCNVYCFSPGQATDLHVHTEAEEVLYVVEGEGEVTTGDETQKVGRGSVVHWGMGHSHLVRNTGSGPMVCWAVHTPLPSVPGPVP